MKEIKSLDTSYKGYKFRSRLEAKWAYYFDQVGVKYEYEPTGFSLGELGCYLPDFYLPELKTYIEIKPEVADRESVFKKLCCIIENDFSSIGKCVAFFGDPLNHFFMVPTRIADDQPWFNEFCEGTAACFDFEGGKGILSTTFNLSHAEKICGRLKTTPRKLIDNYKEKIAARAVNFERRA